MKKNYEDYLLKKKATFRCWVLEKYIESYLYVLSCRLGMNIVLLKIR